MATAEWLEEFERIVTTGDYSGLRVVSSEAVAKERAARALERIARALERLEGVPLPAPHLGGAP